MSNEANQAIQKGAPRGKVLQRLRELGVEVRSVALARAESAPPAMLEFYRKNKTTQGVREQFIQKHGFVPEG